MNEDHLNAGKKYYNLILIIGCHIDSHILNLMRLFLNLKMKYLMSFHNQQGLENILPIAQKLCENELNEVSLLDLRELYGQPKTSFQNLNNIFVKSENFFSNSIPTGP